MSIEKNIERIADALEGILGRMSEAQAVDPAPADTTTGSTTKKKRASKKTAKKTAETPAAAAPMPGGAIETPVGMPGMGAAVTDALTLDKVKAHLQGIMSQLPSPEAVGELIQSLGAARLSELDPGKYPELVEKAEALLHANVGAAGALD